MKLSKRWPERETKDRADPVLGGKRGHRYNHPGTWLASGCDLARLRRFLAARVGQPWDAVYSELCKRVDSRTALEQGLRWSTWQFQIVDGLLQRTPQRPRYCYTSKRPLPLIVSLAGQDYFKHNGLWYRVTLVPLVDCGNPRSYKVIDPHTGKVTRYSWVEYSDAFHPREACRANHLMHFYGRAVCCVKKEAANKREIRKLVAGSMNHKP